MDGIDNPPAGGPTSTVDNPPAGGPTAPSPTPPAGPAPTGVSPEEFQRLQQSYNDLRSRTERWQQQIDGSRQEVQRLQQETEQRVQQAVQQAQQDWQARLAGALGGAQPTADRPVSRQEALDAYYLRNDPSLLDRYEAQQSQQYRQIAREEFAQIQAPAQFAAMVQQRHLPLLKDANSPEFQEVVAEYNRLETDQVTRYFLGENPIAMAPINVPDGRGQITTRQMDLRLLDRAAAEVKARRAAMTGQPPPQAPQVAGGQSTTPDGGSAEPSPETILTEEEKQAAMALFQNRAGSALANESAQKSPAAAMRWLAERLKKDRPAEYQRRVDGLRRVG